MDAFILAAGLGTRLRPQTDRTPKALVEVAGKPMLEHVARRLIAAGADRLVINLHHHAQQVVDYLAQVDGFGVAWAVSHEVERPLDTGGALLHARQLLRRDAAFYLHNVDILTDFPLDAMLRTHRALGALATVAVSTRPSSRGLLFGPRGLYGRVDGEREITVSASTAAPAIAGGLEGRFAFAGVHVLEPAILDAITETGAFSVLDLYLRLIGGGATVAGFRVDGWQWFDIGTPEKLELAEQALSPR